LRRLLYFFPRILTAIKEQIATAKTKHSRLAGGRKKKTKRKSQKKSCKIKLLFSFRAHNLCCCFFGLN